MTFEILDDLLTASNVKLVYLPAYSPELNPCELIFAQVKRNLREHRMSAIPLWFDISVSFATVTLENVIQYYKKCLLYSSLNLFKLFVNNHSHNHFNLKSKINIFSLWSVAATTTASYQKTIDLNLFDNKLIIVIILVVMYFGAPFNRKFCL